jgi:hypothetical protein
MMLPERRRCAENDNSRRRKSERIVRNGFTVADEEGSAPGEIAT